MPSGCGKWLGACAGTDWEALLTGIAFCESDGPVALDAPSATPDDPDYSYQADMKSIGMPAAWATGQFGSPLVGPIFAAVQRAPSLPACHQFSQTVARFAAQVKVCIIDTGMNYLHPDLAGNVWMNPVEMAGPGANAANGYKNGIDDDGDGVCAPQELLTLLAPQWPPVCGRACHALPR